MKYRQNLLKVFTQSELKQMIQKADDSLDKDMKRSYPSKLSKKIFWRMFCEDKQIEPYNMCLRL